ncbi:MAG: adenylate/guanylate cyclase domain-containing protein [Marinospirillum sp.]|uniref:adenylate/guanylate cyclase domain-containing protein n=1 Tax=Marinospirillum sp. TaxID=2183934 RepID=UPI0019FEABA7|nr:adenylate/guanylate cyclase domain-containing protein [Marinospirillum sp.]MBE0506140.1 adenylate/guanylate cyclase domain-containing protein [Marinospirillum sp.]
MFTKSKKLSIMFADICGSTKLYDSLGDERARKVVSDTLNLLTEVIHRYKGTVIKTIGDEIMCTFDDAEIANKAACDMQESLEEANEEGVTEVPVAIRVGYHFGSCIMEDGDVHGDAVNVAARMAAQAKASQIVTTRETANLLPQVFQNDENIRFLDNAHIKGKGEIEIIEFIWKEDDVTCMSVDISSVAASPAMPTQLRLEYRDTFVRLNQEREFAVLGRSATCDIPVNESLASRQHIKIELRRDKFFLIDQSTNGTYVQQSDGSQSFVRREEILLHGEGVISLGRAMNDNPQELIHFSLEA